MASRCSSGLLGVLVLLFALVCLAPVRAVPPATDMYDGPVPLIFDGVRVVPEAEPDIVPSPGWFAWAKFKINNVLENWFDTEPRIARWVLCALCVVLCVCGGVGGVGVWVGVGVGGWVAVSELV
jgi:hypothetical protein